MGLKLHYNLVSTVLFVLAIVLAHVVSTENYDWTKNTISDLGSQSYSRKGIMQLGFISFGATLVAGILMNGLQLRTAPILVYGLCVGLTGIFCTKPFAGAGDYSVMEARLHSVFAQVAGVSFTLGIMLQMVYATDKNEKWAHFLLLVLVVGFSAAFGLAKSYQGIVQRLLYLASFVWLVKFYKP